ncbi:hypothetical protein SAMN02746066_03129 [Anaerosporobacter mobilis DSM 15930]|uniref:Ig-like domain (Group 2) n=1 Tax=Anaerosporobacter mobilis DSM 15930 TaxID=1120996 RepID=A0A1M7L9X4_9FIRM|nr:hypothetical protein [Anaerosporobacter mobilis]SHM74891.1 hypothetical protein SAMN02746066_03129 [Anaerosporobacter mobilis DSM 15930]
MKTKRFLSLFLVLAITLSIFGSTNINAMTIVNLYTDDKYNIQISGANSTKWTSSNKKVASINSKGEIKAISGGTTIITGKTNNTTLTYKVIVYDENEYLTIEKALYEKDLYMKDIIKKLKPNDSIYNDDYYSFNINKKSLDSYVTLLKNGLNETIDLLEKTIPSVDNISFNEDYRVLTIYGSSTEFTDTEEANISALYLSMPHYQMLTNTDFSYQDLIINYCDPLTKSIKKSVTLEEKLSNK